MAETLNVPTAEELNSMVYGSGSTAVEAILANDPESVFEARVRNNDDDVTYTVPSGDK